MVVTHHLDDAVLSSRLRQVHFTIWMAKLAKRGCSLRQDGQLLGLCGIQA